MKPMFAQASVVLLVLLIPAFYRFRRDGSTEAFSIIENKFRSNGTTNLSESFVPSSSNTEASPDGVSVLSFNVAFHVHFGTYRKNRWLIDCANQGEFCFNNIKHYIFGDTFDIVDGFAVGIPKQPVTFLQEASNLFFPHLADLRSGERANYTYDDYHFFISKGQEPAHGQVTIIQRKFLNGEVLFTSGNLGNAQDFRVFSVISSDNYTFVNVHAPHGRHHGIEEKAEIWIRATDKLVGSKYKRGDFTIIGGDLNSAFFTETVPFNNHTLIRTPNWQTCCMENDVDSDGTFRLKYESDYILTNRNMTHSSVGTTARFVKNIETCDSTPIFLISIVSN